MRLIYFITRYSNPSSAYATHIPGDANSNKPACGSRTRESFFTSVVWTNGDKPTCKKCNRILAEIKLLKLRVGKR